MTDTATAREYPTVYADRSDDGSQLVFHCEHCYRDHTHGRHNPYSGCAYSPRGGGVCTCPTGTGDGHRAAHCHDRSGPYRNGYIVKERPTT
ncbi:hypothetical protein [Tomitella gaofuii]|uniref:hypothetical protein n=1 Tax=Tomitella gaofuii TaxID=2760083 RepID=UPI0015FAC41B|nr:hypothetical protein [Tomitella gaofuii]